MYKTVYIRFILSWLGSPFSGYPIQFFFILSLSNDESKRQIHEIWKGCTMCNVCVRACLYSLCLAEIRCWKLKRTYLFFSFGHKVEHITNQNQNMWREQLLRAQREGDSIWNDTDRLIFSSISIYLFCFSSSFSLSRFYTQFISAWLPTCLFNFRVLRNGCDLFILFVNEPFPVGLLQSFYIGGSVFLFRLLFNRS